MLENKVLILHRHKIRCKMAHREIDYSKMADKFETCYPSKNLRSFCYREKIDYRQMLNELRSRTQKRQSKDESEEMGHLYPLNIKDVPPMVQQHFALPECEVSTTEIPQAPVSDVQTLGDVTLTTSSNKLAVTLRGCSVQSLVELINSIESSCLV